MWEFLFPVILFTYFLVQLNQPPFKKKWYKWLYLPFFITLFPDIILDLDFVFKLYKLPVSEDDFIVELLFALEGILSMFYSGILTFWSEKLVKNSSSISKEKKKWLYRFVLFFVSIQVLWFLNLLEELLLDSEYSTNLIWLVVSILFWWVLYYGIFKLQIIVQKDEIHQFVITQNIRATTIKKKKNGTSSKHIDQLYKLMEDDELYKNPLVSRQSVAEKLNISESHLSSIINTELNKSLIQFVNEYRIESAKLLLHDTTFNKYSIEAIGIEAGFNSKSVFYKTFKTYLKMSPGDYRKLQKES